MNDITGGLSDEQLSNLQEIKVTPENPYSKFYTGDGRVHLCKSPTAVIGETEDLYYMKVKSLGRGDTELLLTEDEYNEAKSRANLNRLHLPKPMKFLEFLRIIFS